MINWGGIESYCEMFFEIKIKDVVGSFEIVWGRGKLCKMCYRNEWW